MRVTGVIAAGFAVLLGLSACRNVLNDDEESMYTRMVNLIEDSPTVQYKVDDTVVASAPYLTISAFSPARPGSHAVSFGAVRPVSLVSTDTTEPITLGGSFTQSYTQDTNYTIFAYGTMSDLRTFLIEEPSKKDDLADDFIELTFVNVASNAPSVDVYITAPEGAVTSPENLGTIAFGAKTNVRSMKLFRRADVTDTNAALFTDLIVELRDTASGATLLKTAKIRITEQTPVLFAVTRNIGTGPSPVNLTGIDGISGTYSSPDNQARVRFVHVSPDTPPLDIIRASSLSTPLAADIAFRDTSDYVNVPNGDVDLIAQPADATTSVFLFVEEFAAAPGGSYTAYAVGPLASVDAQILADDRRKVPTQAKFRFFNTAPSKKDGDGLDIYVTTPGKTLDFDSTDDTDTSDDAPQFRKGTAIGFRGVTDSIVYKAATYQVRLMDTGTSRVVLDTTVTLAEGSVQTFVIIDSETGDLELMPVDETL